jgi:hypothetical protein
MSPGRLARLERIQNNEETEQGSGGNGEQRPSFASLWTPILRRATLLTFAKKIYALAIQDP